MNTENNNRKNSARNQKETFFKRAKAFIKDNRKQIISLILTIIIAWFIMEIIANWNSFVSGFQEGLNQ